MMKSSIRAFALLSAMASAMLMSIACTDGDDDTSAVSPETLAITYGTEQLPDDSSANAQEDSVSQDTVRFDSIMLIVDTISDDWIVDPLPEDTIHYLYTSFIVKNEDRYDTITALESDIECDISENDLRCDVTTRSGMCGHLFVTPPNGVVINDTVKLNYGENSQTNFIPNRYVSIPPALDVEAARNATDSLKALCGSVSQEFEAEDAVAEGLPLYVSLSSTTKKICWSSSQYVERMAIEEDSTQFNSSCPSDENEGIPDTSITEFTTCSFDFGVEATWYSYCTATVEHYPEELSMKKFHLTFASAAPKDTTIEWTLKVQHYDGSSDSYNMTTRLFNN